MQELLTHAINVAVLGSGGREHALALKIAASPLCGKVFILPGNDGMTLRKDSKIVTRKIDLSDRAALCETLKAIEASLVVVGPDDLLATGIVDFLSAKGFNVFGPTKEAARIESSKSFSKELLKQTGVPTAESVTLFERANPDALAEKLGGYPIVLKYDGLALGKGVQVCSDSIEVEAFYKSVFDEKKFERKSAEAVSNPKNAIVAEQFLSGHEVSLFALSDGKDYVLLEPACDHKKLLEGNSGPNTGGMGAFSPVPWLSSDQIKTMGAKIFPPILAALAEKGNPFRGLLYAGLMIRNDSFWVLEFNARFGDPETQCILPRLESDLLPLLYGVATSGRGKNKELNLQRYLNAHPLRWSPKACVNIVASSKGYPESPVTGFPIQLECEIEKIYFAGVKKQDQDLVTTGGRVLSVSCLGESVDEARVQALECLEKIYFQGMHYRKDIGSIPL